MRGESGISFGEPVSGLTRAVMNGVLVVLLAAVGLKASPATAESTSPHVEALAAAAGQEFTLIAEAHRALRAYALEIHITYSTGEGSQVWTARVACDNEQRCLRVFQNTTTLQTPGLSLLVNSSDRTMTVAKRDPSEPVISSSGADPTVTADPRQALTDWLQGGGVLSGGEVTAEGRRWVFRPAKPTPPEIQMVVDEHSHLLRRLSYAGVMRGRGPTLVDIRYTWRDPSLTDLSEFEVNRYIQEQGGAFTPAQGYADYRIIRADRR